ncbi:MAG: hypothetical protein D6741_08355, partial [Planctomycetota bacterium]
MTYRPSSKALRALGISPGSTFLFVAIPSIIAVATTLPVAQPSFGLEPAAAKANDWLTDYTTAYKTADADNRLLVVAFYDADDSWCDTTRTRLSSLPDTREFAETAVWAKVPLSARVKSNGTVHRVLEYQAFLDLHEAPGWAVIDLRSDGTDKGTVLRCVANPTEEPMTAANLAALAAVDLPVIPAGWFVPAEKEFERLPLPWMNDYSDAVRRAKAEKRMLLIYFYATEGEQAQWCRRFEEDILPLGDIRKGMQSYVLAKLPMNAVMRDGTPPDDGEQTQQESDSPKEIVILDHPSFAEMLHLPGLAIVDYASEGEKYYGTVVSVFPFQNGHVYTRKEMNVILNLPPATLTQRTMIYAVRVHPEHPASADGKLDRYLLSEAEKHSLYQARIRLQGHHNWEQRFHRISAHIPPGTLASEVCAESWPGQHLLESAIECVRCWRLSPGHWHAV